MGWQPEYPFFLENEGDTDRSVKQFSLNRACFIRKNHTCGKVFGASKSCFIACPTEDEIETQLALITEKLGKVGIEAIIATKERAYGQDIFCTKICGKIIESKFCLVILNDKRAKGHNVPNPNVYYEYGLMTALNKHIIPLQEEKSSLAFNIQSYDTIKYNSKNLAGELDIAINDAIRITESLQQVATKYTLSDKTVMRNFELSGFEFRSQQSNWFLKSALQGTGFIGFANYSGKFYVYLGKINNENELMAYLEDLKMVLYRTDKKHGELQNSIDRAKKEIRRVEIEAKKTSFVLNIRSGQKESSLRENIKEQEERLELMSTIFIGFIIDSGLNRTVFVEKALSLVSQNGRYKLVFDEDGEIKFNNIAVDLRPTTL